MPEAADFTPDTGLSDSNEAKSREQASRAKDVNLEEHPNDVDTPLPNAGLLPLTNGPTSTSTSVLLSLLSLPVQALALFFVSKLVHQLVLSIDEIYEAVGRRARSKFVAFPWIRIAIGLALMAVYHAALWKLTVRSWKALRRGG